jgi:hypothetical protein
MVFGAVLGVGIISVSANSANFSVPAITEVSTVESMRSGVWSDPGVWSGGKVPAPGSRVVISPGMVVVYDSASTDSLHSLEVRGTLGFSRNVNTNLDVGDVIVFPKGRLEIGTREQPIPASVTARIRLVNEEEGQHSLMVLGEAQVHGAPVFPTFTFLARTTQKGQSWLELAEPVDWPAGGRIVVAATGSNPGEVEEFTIAWVWGRMITLDKPLRFIHSGEELSRGEVALLTRNVLITSRDITKRGHTIFHEGAKGGISYAEFAHLGAQGQLGKYPIHFHMTRDTMRGTVVEGVSVHDSGNRFITVHSTNGVTLRSNVGYKAIGHGFFLEDGDEVDNIYERNLGILTMPGKILPSDAYAAAFWTQNPANTWRGNYATAGRRGFQLEIPDRQMAISGRSSKISLRALPLGEFRDNTAHTIGREGIRVDGLHMRYQGTPREIVGFRSWRNREYGAYLNAANTVLVNPFFFGSQKGNVVLEGIGLRIMGGRVLGEIAADQRTAPLGVILKTGTNLVLDGVVLEGHLATGGLTAADVMLFQESETPVRAAIINSRLGSPRPLIFGFPRHEGSQVEVRGYQGHSDDNFLLYRIDLPLIPSCVGEPTADLQIVASRCPLRQRDANGLQGGGLSGQ